MGTAGRRARGHRQIPRGPQVLGPKSRAPGCERARGARSRRGHGRPTRSRRSPRVRAPGRGRGRPRRSRRRVLLLRVRVPSAPPQLCVVVHVFRRTFGRATSQRQIGRSQHVHERAVRELRVAVRAPRIRVPEELLKLLLRHVAPQRIGSKSVLRAFVHPHANAHRLARAVPFLAQRVRRPAPIQTPARWVWEERHRPAEPVLGSHVGQAVLDPGL